jgi:hypothetical protein
MATALLNTTISSQCVVTTRTWRALPFRNYTYAASPLNLQTSDIPDCSAPTLVNAATVPIIDGFRDDFAHGRACDTVYYCHVRGIPP